MMIDKRNREIKREDWGSVSYTRAYEQQKRLFEENIGKKSRGEETVNTLVFCEHPHVITVGRHGLLSNLLFPEALLKEKGVELIQTDRGGDITYHGPGQLVVYPVFDLENFGIGLKEYIRRLEESVIRLLAHYSVDAERLAGATGVWLETDNPARARKICAIGVKSSRFITMHGLALNIATHLDYFRLINPCGFTDKGVTSLEKEMGHRIDPKDLKERLFSIFIEIFSQIG